MMIDWQVQLYWQQSWNVNLIFANNWQGRPRSGSKRRFCKSSQWWCDLIKWAQIPFSTFMSNSNVKSLSLKTEQSTTDISVKIKKACISKLSKYSSNEFKFQIKMFCHISTSNNFHCFSIFYFILSLFIWFK